MSLLNYPVYDCATESDVEQKFLFPLLTHPSFLEIPIRAILTKRSIGALTFVEKSTLPKNYVPDYLLFFEGFPVCVIEAKGPEIDVEQAISEARLYAQVLNAQFPSGTHPVLMVVGCNGRELAIGAWDTNEHQKFATGELLVGTYPVIAMRDLMGAKRLSDHAVRIQRRMTRHTYVTSSRQLDSQLFVERIKPNALARYLNPLYEMFFRAEDPEKINLILERAYVDTAELREYDEVLHAMLRQIERGQSSHYQAIQTDRRREYTLTPEITRYGGDIGSHGRLHLIIGSRGSGKSLFIARFFSHLIPPALKARAAWCVLDFNRAPSSIEDIEEYICDKFVEIVENVGFDPFQIEGLKWTPSVGPLGPVS
jgi:hypothetical protein